MKLARLHLLALFVPLMVIASVGAVRAENAVAPVTTAPTSYTWKAGDVYRFDYFKSITLAANLKDPTDQRKTDVAGILIFEVASDGKATMRFDSPRVTLPEVIIYSSQSEDPEVQKDKTRVIAKTIEGALKAARWDVQLGSDGTLHIRDRKPGNFIEWAKEVESAGGWRKKSFKGLQQLIDNDLGLKVQVDDQDIFLCLGNPAPAPAAKAETALRPVRTKAVEAGVDGEKTRFTFTRVAPVDAGKPFVIPDMTAPGQMAVTLNKVQSVDGTAVMDNRLAMLDTLNEEFTTDVLVTYGKESESRQVRVQYRIKRLAPPITKQ